MIIRLRLVSLAFGTLLATFAAQALALDYPIKPIRIVVPQPPGGGVDAAARIISQKLNDVLGWQIVIDNRPGASGTLGASAVAKGIPDGYTLLFCPGDFVTVPSLMPQMNFDPYKDLIPITLVSSNPLVVVANANATFGSVKELINAARASPDGIGYSTPGHGTINHMVGEWISTAAQAKLLHVPYRGGAAAVNGVVAGDVPLGITSPPPVRALIDAGKLKVIGLTGKRPSFMPSSWSTLAENGLAIDAVLWLGMFAQSGTPEAIVTRVDQAIAQVLQDDSVRRRLNDLGAEPGPVSGREFVERIRTDAARFEQIIRQTGIRIER